MPRIRVVLESVVCGDPEDIGGDEFYVAGAVSDGAQTAGVLTRPIDLDKNQTKAFGIGGGTVFDFDVPDDRILKVALIAYDEDSNKDWTRHGEMVTKLGQAVSAGLGAIPNPYTAAAGMILPFALNAVGQIMMMDQDDELGQLQAEFPVMSLSNGEHTQFWNFTKEGGWYSSWRYAVQYKVIKG